MLSNDTDANSDPLTAIQLTSTSHGSLTFNSDGSFTYTPNAGYVGSDSFTYRVTDGIATSAAATVSISVLHVNHAPVANDDIYATAFNTPLNVAAPGVLVNDTDADGDSLTAVLISGPAHGTLALNANGSFSYTPNTNYSGTDTFTYAANDGLVNGNTATVTVTVNSDIPPVASDDSYSVNEDGTLNVAAPGVSANDTDVNTNVVLTASLVSGPTNGILTLNADGSFVYTPTPLFFGTDTFVYKASDGFTNSSTATVTITVNHVNHAPVANDDNYSVNEDGTLNVSAAGVLANDTDADGDSLSAALVGGPAHGSVTLNADGSFVYTPTPLYFGTDTFTYQANDGQTNSATATVTITVNHVNHPPVANNDSYSLNEDGSLTVPASGVWAMTPTPITIR